jgi:TolB-like protein/Flp pilus assembly protein TadD
VLAATTGGRASVTQSSKAVFLSYASQDTGVARRMCDALRVAGIEVWFDQSELRGGDSWDQKIRQQIRDCALFVPIISAHTQARPEGYFRLEWKLAVDRSHLMAAEKAFLVPVVVDATTEPEALVPTQFRDVQWTRIQASEIPAAFMDRIAALLNQPVAPHMGSTERGASRAPPRRLPVVSIALSVAAVAVLVIATAMPGGWLWPKPAPKMEADTASASVATTPAAVSGKSVAVLPFVDMSEKKDQEYFADGVAEEIINLLAKVPELKVIGRTSSFQFKGKADDLRKIGTTLGAAYVVEGSVGRFDKHVRVTAQLIDTRDGTYRWSETYDRDVSDVLMVQEDVAFAIVRALQLEVASRIFRRSQSAPPTVDAYDTYLRGLHARDRFDQRGFEEAVADFRHALQLEPSFSPAAEATASTLYYMTESTYLPSESGFNQARAAAEAALKLDRRSSVAHAVICIINTAFDWDWSAAARECAIAARISPNKPFVLQAVAVQHMALGEWKDAASSIEAAIANDPLDPAMYNIAARIYVRAGRVREAETAVRRSRQISSTFAFDHLLLGITLLMEGRATEALAEMQQESGPGAQALGLALAYHALHRDMDADAALSRLKAENGSDSAFSIAEAYAFRKQKDAAFEWLDRAFAQRDNGLYSLKGAPLLRNLEGDPRYKAFLRKMNLPD